MTTTATAPESTLDTVGIVPSFIRDSWWTPDAGSIAGAAPVLLRLIHLFGHGDESSTIVL